MIATLPIRTATCVGAQVALQRCPILRTGAMIITFNVFCGSITKLLTEKIDHYINQGGQFKIVISMYVQIDRGKKEGRK